MAPGFTLPKPTVFLFQPTLGLCLLLYSSSQPHIIFDYSNANFDISDISLFFFIFRIGVNLELGKPICGNCQFCGFVSSSSSSPVLEQRRELGLCSLFCSCSDLSVGLVDTQFWSFFCALLRVLRHPRNLLLVGRSWFCILFVCFCGLPFCSSVGLFVLSLNGDWDGFSWPKREGVRWIAQGD